MNNKKNIHAILEIMRKDVEKYKNNELIYNKYVPIVLNEKVIERTLESLDNAIINKEEFFDTKIIINSIKFYGKTSVFQDDPITMVSSFLKEYLKTAKT